MAVHQLRSKRIPKITKGQRVVIIDDFVATGCTVIAYAELLTENFDVKRLDILILCIISS